VLQEMTIDESKFAGIDLNLLVVFMVLFRERSVSKTAQCLNLKQPAISGSLSRLRARFNDPLFVRVGPRGMRPTSKAIELAAALLPLLSAIQGIVNECHIGPQRAPEY
jgi:DNA-binding transcriptional LysR family regulator